MLLQLNESKHILDAISSRKGQVAVLIDPDKCKDERALVELLDKASFAGVDYLFVGGSTVAQNDFHRVIDFLNANTEIPIVIFPGASHQISEKADALLYLSLISGRNPDFLIGHHVQSASQVFDMNLEVIPTGYILIDGGTHSSVAYVSQTTPIPSDRHSIILNTAKAGLLQGKQIIYLDAGSGAKHSIPTDVINALNELSHPIIVGGGIRSIEQMEALKRAGANIVVIGNRIEENMDFLLDIQAFTSSSDKSVSH